MNMRHILFGALISIALITGIFMSIKGESSYPIPEATVMQATETEKLTAKKKPCSCCVERIQRLKEAIRRSRERRNADK